MIAFVVKLTLLFGMGIVCAALLRSRSAALRHLVWVSTLAGAIVLAAAARVVPPIEIPMRGLGPATTAPIPAAAVDGGLRDKSTNYAIEAVDGSVPTGTAAARPSLTVESALASGWLAG